MYRRTEGLPVQGAVRQPGGALQLNLGRRGPGAIHSWHADVMSDCPSYCLFTVTSVPFVDIQPLTSQATRHVICASFRSYFPRARSSGCLCDQSHRQRLNAVFEDWDSTPTREFEFTGQKHINTRLTISTSIKTHSGPPHLTATCTCT